MEKPRTHQLRPEEAVFTGFLAKGKGQDSHKGLSIKRAAAFKIFWLNFLKISEQSYKRFLYEWPILSFSLYHLFLLKNRN